MCCLCVLLFLLADIGLAQTRQDTITLKLEMVNPHGVIDKRTYFKATLKNETPDFRFVLMKSRLFPKCDVQTEIISMEIEHKDGTIEASSPKPMFSFEYKKT